jgi:hypothetical protein
MFLADMGLPVVSDDDKKSWDRWGKQELATRETGLAWPGMSPHVRQRRIDPPGTGMQRYVQRQELCRTIRVRYPSLDPS